MVNPGGLNEKFANENLSRAKVIVHQRNEEIPSLVAEGEADVMIYFQDRSAISWSRK
jgi:hypothetical protein